MVFCYDANLTNIAISGIRYYFVCNALSVQHNSFTHHSDSNIQPFKKVVIYYSSIEQVFVILLSFFYVALLGRNISGINRDVYRKIMTLLALISAIVPLAYIILCLLIGLWFVSRKGWINVFIRRL